MNAPVLPISQRFGRYHAQSHRWMRPNPETWTPREWWLCFYEFHRDSTAGGFKSMRLENALRAMLALYGKRNVDPLMVSLRRGSIGSIGPSYETTAPLFRGERIPSDMVRDVDQRRRTLALARDERVRFGHYGARLP